MMPIENANCKVVQMRILMVSEAYRADLIPNPHAQSRRQLWNRWRRYIRTKSRKAQTSGVVIMLKNLCKELNLLGHEYCIVHPDLFPNVPYPPYPEIRLAWDSWSVTTRFIDSFKPDAVHIFTEGPLGVSAARQCAKRRVPFTTSFHTKYPEYFFTYYGIPSWVTYPYFRWFHGNGARTMVSTKTLETELEGKGFERLAIWPRGVDTELFCPGDPGIALQELQDLPRPWYLYVGRISEEKNLPAFLEARPKHPGTKIIIGDGPQEDSLRDSYPEIVFLGRKSQEEIVRYYRAANVFVMPSRSETLGLVTAEALACGLPVAAFPVSGPMDFIQNDINGHMDENLAVAMDQCLRVERAACRRSIEHFTWRRSALEFVSNLVPL